ncbi:uL15 family ribosomal protein [Candidatus Pacearchaeota archaeon]|nr:uL15 family ribosomal protein [Candidatus Pacearchaeota archaeon]
MISKTQINKRLEKKRNPELREIITLAKAKSLLELGKKLTGPTKKQSSINVGELNEIEEKNIIVVGRVLGQGEIDKKITVAALGFSEQAREKLAKAGCEIRTIKQEIEKNPGLKGVKIL